MLGAFCPFPFRLGAIDATNGVTAEEYSRMGADTVASVRAAPFAILTFTTGPMPVPVVHAYNGQNGVGVGFAPPTLTPTGPGEVVVSWEYSYANDYLNSYPVDFNSATATPHGPLGSGRISATTEINDSRTVTVRLFDMILPIDGKVTLKVF